MMVTGQLPFRSTGPLDAWMKKIQNELTPPRQLVPSLSERVDWAIRRAMSADPEMRPGTCREFVEDLTGRSTRKIGTTTGPGAGQELWYLQYEDEEGGTNMVKGPAPAIRRSLKEGLLGDASNVRASRSKAGPFEPLRSYPEFRDLVIGPAPVSPPGAKGTVTGGSKPEPKPRATPAQEAPTGGPKAPKIDLGAPSRGGPAMGEWVKLILLLAVGIATAVAGFFFLFSRGH
jgi:hypothetical protein